MQFKKTYQETSFTSFYRPYYYVDGKRVSEETFLYKEDLCRIKGMQYNSSILYTKGNRYHACFCYD
jgi:hypothetical protein